VTARKMKENILHAPVAVTAISGTALKERDMTDISAVADIAPNVNFSFAGTSSGSSSAAVVYIRGVGQNDFTPVTDPGVGIYIDGVYLARTIGSIMDNVDLESIEVLRGPQGTLFGRNTIGGAISLTTRDPGDEYAGHIRASGGDDERAYIFGSVDLPFTKNFRASFSGFHKSRAGYVDRVLTGEKLGDENVSGGRAKFVWDASETLTLKLSVDGTRTREGSAPEVLTGIGGTFTFLYNNNIFGNGAPPACAGGGPVTNPACANSQYVGAPFKSFDTGPSINNVDQWGVALTAEWQALDNISVKSISAYRKIKAKFARPSDGTPFLIFQTTSTFNQYQYSQELQVNGASLEGKLNWVAGAFYMKEKASDFDLVEAVVPSFPRIIGGDNDNDNIAAFGEGTYDVTQKIHVTGGVRYTHETKRFNPDSRIIPPAQPSVTVPRGQESLTFNEVTWRGILAYDILDKVSSYFSVSKGFKSGGFIQRLTQPVTRIGTDQLPTFSPERVTSYEVGLKAEIPEYGLRLALAAFTSDYKDIQVAANPPGQINTVTANAARATIKGVEAELTWIPVPELFIQGSAGYLDANYDSVAPNNGVNISLGDALIRSPKFTSDLGVSYRIDFGNLGTLVPRVDWTHKTSIQFEPVNDARVASKLYDNVNMSAAYNDPDNRWRLTFGVNNVFNKIHMIAGDSNGTIGYALAVFNRPRNWYLKIEASF